MAEQNNLNGRVANDLLHDLSAGLFPGAVIAAWLLRAGVDRVDPGRGAVVAEASEGLWLILAFALSLLIATGIMRLRYWRLNVRSGFLESKRHMAVTKHVVFVTVQLLAAVALAMM